MVRVYKKPLGTRPYSNYNKNYMLRALQAVKTKQLSIRQASERYAVPKSTLAYKVKNLHELKPGRQPVLNTQEEKHLVEGIIQCAEWGFPLTQVDVRLIVKGYLDHAGKKTKIFKDNYPGPDWIKLFYKRNLSDVTVRLCENIKRSRAAVSKKIVVDYFTELEKTLEGIPPENIYNFDETNFSDDPGRVQVLVKRGCKHADRITDTSKTAVSVMMAGNASGELLPPYVCYKSEHLWQSWTLNGPKGCRYNRTRSGWFDLCVFEDWFESLFIPSVAKKQGRKVVICDNLSSHMSLHVIQLCKRHNISFVLLPPNSTHLLQPLDVAYFKPLKSGWRSALTKWKMRNRGLLAKEVFPSLLKDALNAIEDKSADNMKAGFAACGVYPLDSLRVLSKLPDETDNSDSLSESWTDSFVSLLKESRLNTSARPRATRKKITVKPGRSVCSPEEIVEEESSDEDQEENDAILTESEPEREETSSSDESRIEEGYRSPENSYAELPTTNSGSRVQDYAVADFVLTKFEFGKNTKKYVGRIVEIMPNSQGIKYKTQFLRPNSTSNTTFVYPVTEDIMNIEASDIIYKLTPPEELRRGGFRFSKPLF